MPTPPKLSRAGTSLRKRALAYPEAYEELPWGHYAFKVKGKSFLFLACEDGGTSLSTKLPSSSMVALMLPFATPTEYGLGKSGWVTARFARGEAVPVDTLALWIEESYCAVAPKKLAAEVRANEGPPVASRPRAKAPVRTTKRKTTKNK
jgi:predicted DNA-binding protein (MmcQ/YjbR family)